MPFKPNPEREILYDDIATLLSRGNTPVTEEIEYMLPFYSYSPDSAQTYAHEIMDSYRTYRALILRGVKLVTTIHKSIKIYRDGSLDIGETDFTKTQQHIDNYWAEIAASRASKTED